MARKSGKITHSNALSITSHCTYVSVCVCVCVCVCVVCVCVCVCVCVRVCANIVQYGSLFPHLCTISVPSLYHLRTI